MTENITTPTHVGIIMDGNRRWAHANGLPALQGHTRGLENIKVISKHAFESGIKYITVYAFSMENWRRKEEEIGHLMSLLVKAIDKYLDEFHEAGLRVVLLGTNDGLNNKIIDAKTKAEELTKNNTNGTLAICFNYSGLREIADATAKIIQSGIKAEEITVDMIAENLYSPEIPPIDLIIRTSGEQRLSNFMLWRAAYSELYFVSKHWPEFSAADFDEALKEYKQRGRRFGG